jgi:hypothetical protein
MDTDQLPFFMAGTKILVKLSAVFIPPLQYNNKNYIFRLLVVKGGKNPASIAIIQEGCERDDCTGFGIFLDIPKS